jgi:DNA phosphorothioation-dependent restriction protein DptH
MNRLVKFIASSIRRSVEESILAASGNEFRQLFHGPPQQVLDRVLDELSSGGGIQATRPSGEAVLVLVVRKVDALPPDTENPRLNESGTCDSFHLMNLRNANPPVARWIALLTPASHVDLSIASAVGEFGVRSAANSGTATIADWISDPYIESLIASAIENLEIPADSRGEARKLIEAAMRSADERDQYNAQRCGPWAVLARIFDIPHDAPAPLLSLSLACGAPPRADGKISAEAQCKLLEQLASRFEEQGFRGVISEIADIATDADKVALKDFVLELSRRCALPTAFARAGLAVYGPAQDWTLDVPPEWWRHLTVERWAGLLDEATDETKPDGGSISFSCGNSLVSYSHAVDAIVVDEVVLKVDVTSAASSAEVVRIWRKVAKKSDKREWVLDPRCGDSAIDTEPPIHKGILGYAAEFGSHKRDLKVICLARFSAGVFVDSRTASKVIPPKEAGGRYETWMSLEGSGRHYLDLFAADWAVLPTQLPCLDSDNREIDGRSAELRRIGPNQYGLEIDAVEECTYVIDVVSHSGGSHKVRVNISIEEVPSVDCSSEFERLVKLNTQKSATASVGVYVVRSKRAADLQAWALDPTSIDRSYYPVVVASDLDKHWVRTEWATSDRMIFSKGRYIADPRPTRDEMEAPLAFIEARRKIAEYVRGKDEDGLVESARLGEWAANDAAFRDAVQDYLHSYRMWVEAAPDVAPWADVVAVSGIEQDGVNLALEPVAILLSPLHPLRLGWQVAAQRTLWQAYARHERCPAGSILDPRCVPDVVSLPLRTATGTISLKTFLAVDSSSDYWGILWNGEQLSALPSWAGISPFNNEFGLQVGGISSGFSTSQVGKALDDVSDMLAAKPTLSVLVSSAAGQTNACNKGVLDWCKERLGGNRRIDDDGRHQIRIGPRRVQILDERPVAARPDDAELSNLAEDTNNSVHWFDAAKASRISADLGIIAQLDAANCTVAATAVRSPLSAGALIRHRVRQQLTAGNGAFLNESRTSGQSPQTGDVLLDRLADAVSCMENLGANRVGYSFAPSITAVQSVLSRATFAAVSSSAVDPACFLGGWLNDSFLWEYELPSYSQRAGDSNGYYLLSQIGPHVLETLASAISKLPGCDNLSDATLQSILREVASRGIPTVGGLSSGDHKAAGDLGLFLAARLLQDEFRGSPHDGLLRITEEIDGRKYVNIIIPVDPFRGYLEDLGRSLKLERTRPDLLVACFDVTDAQVRCKLTPIEVKFRGTEAMQQNDRTTALGQPRALTRLFKALRGKAAASEAHIWSLAYQHLLVTMVSFGLRVYSQKTLTADGGREWASIHEKIVGSILSGDTELEIDECGRLIVFDTTGHSAPSDDDHDGFQETLLISLEDAASMVLDVDASFPRSVKQKLGSWQLRPGRPHDIDRPLTSARAEDSATKNPPDSLEPERDVVSKGAASSLMPAIARPAVEYPSSGGQGDATAEDHDGERSLAKAQEATIAAPAPPSGVRIHVGLTTGYFEPKERVLRLSETELNHLNIGVVGDLGTGKTQFLKSLILQAASAAGDNRGIRPRFLIFDYKNDYASADFVKAVGAKVVKPRNIPLNIFDVGNNPDSNAWIQRFNFFYDTLSKVFAGIGPVQRHKLKAAVKSAYDQAGTQGKQPTMRDVHREYAANMGNNADAPFGIIDDLIDMEVFASDPPPDATFGSFFDGVVVLSLSDLGQDDRNKNMLVALFLNMFYEYMLTIPKRPYEGQPQKRALDSFLLVDEADNIMKYEFDVLRKLLLQGREFGVGIVLASQYLKHFKVNATDYREPLLSWFVHKVPNVTAQEISALGLTDELAELAVKVKQLANHHCLFKTVGVAGEIVKVTPFHELVKRT